MKPGRSWQNNLPALFSVLLLLILNLTEHTIQLRDQIFHILNTYRHTQGCVGQAVLSPESPSEHLHGSGSVG